MTNLYFILIPILAFITFQDFKNFSIHLILLISFILLSIFITSRSIEISDFIFRILLNFSVIGIEFLSILFYIKLRNGAITLNESIGIGDLLFMIGTSFIFDVIDFVYFQLFAFSLSILYHFTVQLFSSQNGNKIPLAGIMAVLLLPYLYIAI